MTKESKQEIGQNTHLPYMTEQLEMDMQVKERAKRLKGGLLRSERQRLGLTHEQLGTIGGVSEEEQEAYEMGDMPDSIDYLTRIGGKGIDIGLIVLGVTQTQLAERAIDWKMISHIVNLIWEWESETGLKVKPNELEEVIRKLYREYTGNETLQVGTFENCLEEATKEPAP